MRSVLIAVVVWAAGAMALEGAVAPPAVRTACISTNKLPELTGVVDVRQANSGNPNLKAGDFLLLDGGHRQASGYELKRFGDSGLGLALIVALDASGSMKGRPLAAIQNGLLHLVSRKRPEDKIAVLSFADDTRWEAKWDASDSQLQDSFRNLRGRGHWTRLYDAMEFALAELSRAGRENASFPQRQSILVISDGHDEGSRATLADLQSRIQGSRIRVDAVGLANSPLWLGSLRQMAQAGFGGFRAARSPSDLESILGKGIDTLLDMPVVQFKAANLAFDGRMHHLAVEYAPAGTSDGFDVNVPRRIFSGVNLWYWAAAGGALILAFLIWMLFGRAHRAQPVPAVAAPQPAFAAAGAAPASPSAAPVMRPPTAAEFRLSSITSDTAPVIRYGEPSSDGVAVKPARAGTVLAPNGQTAAGPLELSAMSGPYAGQKFRINAQEFWIGSAPNNHLCLSADPTVSGNHACIRTEQPFSRVYDNGSLNNTWVNGRAVGQDVILIRPGDHMRIGQSEFLLEAGV